MSPTSINVAVIGCGRIAGHHCRSIRAVDGIRLTAVCDLVADKAQAYGSEFAVPFYTDYRVMVRTHPEIDVVAVITPSGMHFEHAMEIIGDFGKHVVVEKPTFMRPSQFIAARTLADKSGVQLFPVFQNRYNKAVRRVKHAIETGELGAIRIISVRTRWCRPQRYYDLAPWRGTFAQDGGCLTNQGIHHVDLLRHLGGEVERVNATMRTLGADIEVEDSVVATFTYPSGAIGNLEVTTAARPDDFEASLSIVGEKGLAQIGGIAVNELQVFTPDPTACSEASEDFSSCVYGFGHEAMYRDIAASFHQGRPYPVAPADCLGSLRLLNAFYRADEAGGWVEAAAEDESPRLGRADDALAALYQTPR
ncbi:Gfo/Idh/MocA family protein [Magnetospirillum gryphiswaldense]|uniref:Oxidoreductase, N-terminal:Oxidoreductase n=1 Tax=Magnetospirillum gryphiswaldense TaxID=55518 RepID=A4U165_9PROT|nr:Gfo/Idh/MocA family oxidoreductase [Magnetospirillum gryphiswaldense]AVM75597.1 putative oxidoreductase YcjS [Magnetospirillum gryphiswaldense MSR-1]AVM79500.1 putative oxidoreductase YcjS [Magnetospirillum gryphiswaldense]CAM76622.1 Oxidoreductase, N-terminal:Oxidoreductase [Magnetospirillum gryphiswaldense MSR-1]